MVTLTLTADEAQAVWLYLHRWMTDGPELGDATDKLEAAMDERRTGEPGYRRRITEVRFSNPQRPGRPIPH